ncbi:MAG: ATP-binding protein [Chloroflexi bacterium]|nr:MAG: ATP-binding protein [Chloroflexota bacterium]
MHCTKRANDAKKGVLLVEAQRINPYYDYDAVRDLAMFFGRQYELRMLFNAIEKRQCFSIVGSRHIGKSSLLKFLANRELQQRYGYDLHDRIFILTDWREYRQKTRADFFHTVCEQFLFQCRASITLQSPPEQLCAQDRFKKLLEDVCEAGFRPVLLMDAFDKVTRNPHFDPDFFSFLRALAGIYDLISYVTASMKPLYEVCHSDAVASSPFFNIFQTCVLSSLTFEETQQLITVPAGQTGLAFTPAELEWVTTMAGSHPFYIQVACRHLFAEKARQGLQSVDLKLVQERVYEELEPHFEHAWNDLSEDQKQSLKLDLTQFPPERCKMPELSQSSLFRHKVREFVQVNGNELSLKDLKDALENIEDNDFLANSRLVEMHYVALRMQSNPHTKKGVLVRDLLKAGFERMRAGGVRTDSAPEWRLYNILWYHYFKYHLPNGQTSSRLGLGSMRQFYREQDRALQTLLKEILDLEQTSLNNLIIL